VTATAERTGAPGSLEHDALFYANDDDYVAGVLGFVRGGLQRDEPVLVAVPGWNLDLLREALSAEEMPRVRLRDMTVAGRNPGRIIGTVLTAFVREHTGRRVRIVGEPIWPERTDEEYPACAEHEALINVALADEPASILCPYDSTNLPGPVLQDAIRTHPVLSSGAERWESPAYADAGAVAASFDVPLAPPPDDAEFVVVNSRTGPRVARRVAHEFGERVGLGPQRLDDLRLAVQEVATNTIQHAGGSGLLSVWCADGHLVFQIEDGGRITDPLAGRRPPGRPDVGHGLYVVHQIADLVRVHRGQQGTTVRAYFALG